jgi:G3E family GTPase
MVTAVDAVLGAETLDRHPEAVRQAAFADRIVLTKTDLLANDADPEALRGRLRELNPSAEIVTVSAGESGAGTIIDDGLFDAGGKIPDVRRWLRAEAVENGAHGHDHGHHHKHDVNRHDARIHSFVLTAERPIGRGALDTFLDILRTSFGPRLLRLKGLVDIAENPGDPVVIQGVQHVLHVPAILPEWPDADRRTRLVLIVDDVPREAVERLWGAFTGQPAVDAPDAAALADNPLAPATMARRN